MKQIVHVKLKYWNRGIILMNKIGLLEHKWGISANFLPKAFFSVWASLTRIYTHMEKIQKKFPVVSQNLLKYGLLLNAVSSTRRGMDEMPRTWRPSGVMLTNVTTTGTKQKLWFSVSCKSRSQVLHHQSSTFWYSSGAGEGCAPTAQWCCV